ncbi:MAG: T9SS type A sorting domain-containing protein [Bacteroidales bacterium]|nr:T9SS type A sorting domain-containing protein [Bacteroidales bacterium]
MKRRTIKTCVLVITIIGFLGTANSQDYAWTQSGADIDGEAAKDYFGYSICISDDGSTVAVGAKGNDGAATLAGHVRVFRNISGNWTQIGADIDGEEPYDQLGWSVGLSGDGSTVAVGALGNTGVNDAGYVKVYKYASGSWQQVGAKIKGEADGDECGSAVSLNSDGTIVAIGARMNSGAVNTSGHVRVYKNVSGTWTQIGADIDGEGQYDLFGDALELSSDGSTVAIGALQNNGSGNLSGHTRVYKNVSGSWTKIGADIDGEAAGDKSGSSVSLSGDGTTVAIGSPYNEDQGRDCGQVRVYKNIAGTWTQIGADIEGKSRHMLGFSVTLNGDGTVLATGAKSGFVQVFQNVSGTWVQIGPNINSEADGDRFGHAVSLNADGTIIGVGAIGNDGAGDGAGHVRVHYKCEITTSVDVVTACESYTWMDGVTYTQSNNTATYTLTNAAGCDSIITLNLTINKADNIIEDTLACESFTWPTNGQTYTKSGIYTETLTNQYGCDSVITLNLTIGHPNAVSEDVTACNRYRWPANSRSYTESGVYTTTLTNIYGCDSVLTLNLTIGNSDPVTENISACQSYTWPATGNTYTTSGKYTTTLTNSLGCDSVVTLNLTIGHPNEITENITSCNTYTWSANGNTYTSSGVYEETLTNTFGCDSVVTLNLTIQNSNNSTQQVTACDNYTWLANDVTYSQSGIYKDTLTNAYGCDSIITLHLTINKYSQITQYITECDTYTWAVNGNTYTESGIYTETFINAMGCDSVLVLNLTIGNTTSEPKMVSTCKSYTWPANGNTYTESGEYTTTLKSSLGCDSVVTINLVINSVDISTTQNGKTLTSNQDGASYQWLSCQKNYGIIRGETGQSFIAKSTGDYAVEVRINGCADTSACVNIITPNSIDNLTNSKIKIYPNPTNGQLKLDFTDNKLKQLSITDFTGKTVLKKVSMQHHEIIDLSGFVNGIYMINVQSDKENFTTIVHKQ